MGHPEPIKIVIIQKCPKLLRIYGNTHSGQKRPDNFDEISQAKAWLGKYLNGKWYLEHYQQLSFKYFIKWFEIFKL